MKKGKKGPETFSGLGVSQYLFCVTIRARRFIFSSFWEEGLIAIRKEEDERVEQGFNVKRAFLSTDVCRV